MHGLDETEIKRREKIVIDECGGIQPPCRNFYIYSILFSADRANAAYLRFIDHLKAEPLNPVNVTSSLHEALAHAAALSRFFWPAQIGGVAAARAATLRQLFHLKDDSPLKDRCLRNALEHFDERLDDYLLRRDVGHFFPTPMINERSLAREPTANIFKLVDPTSGCFVILNEEFEFGPIIEEVNQVLKIAEGMTNS